MCIAASLELRSTVRSAANLGKVAVRRVPIPRRHVSAVRKLTKELFAESMKLHKERGQIRTAAFRVAMRKDR